MSMLAAMPVKAAGQKVVLHHLVMTLIKQSSVWSHLCGPWSIQRKTPAFATRQR
jgi:hypothetical protein